MNDKKINLLMPLASALIAFLILSLPAILSFTQHLSYIERGQHQQLTFTQENSLPPGSLISLINPFSTSASISWIQTDPLMRNSYFGLFPLLLVTLALSSRLFKFNKNALFFFLAALFCWLLSFGKYFFLHSIAYHYLPLFNTFRHPALLRIISIFSMLIVAGFSLHYLETKKSFRQIKLITQITMILMLAAGFILAYAEFEKLFAHPENYTSLLNEFKSLNFTQRFFLQFPFAFIFIGLTLLLFQQRKLYPLILLLSIAEVFIFSQFALPVTVIGSKKFDELERLLNRNNIVFPLLDLKSVGENGLHSEDSLKICGSTIPYVKRITRNDYYITPGNLKMQDSFYESSIKDKIFKNAFIYIADTIASFDDKTNYSGERIAFTMDKHLPLYQQKNNSNISLNSISANSISTIASSEKPTILVLQQNNYPGWKASIDGQKTDIISINKAFMAIHLPKGKHLVKFSYQPNKIIVACYVTALGWAMLFLYFLFGCRRIFLRKQEQ
jgi:hypothetical protein